MKPNPGSNLPPRDSMILERAPEPPKNRRVYEDNFNWRPWTVAVVLLIVTFTWIASDQVENAAQIEPRTEREMAIRNSARLDNLEHDIRELEKWRDEHTREDQQIYGRVGVVELQSGTHEKYVVAIVGAFLAALGALIMSVFTRRAQASMHQQTRERLEGFIVSHAKPKEGE